MQNDIIIAGFGGQGVLFGGMLLAQAAVEAGKQTTWFPSYGAEMRGGTANSTVIISDDEIGSPIVSHPTGLLAMNEPSLIKFLPRAKAGAIVIYNSSLINAVPAAPAGVTLVAVPASDIADRQLGNMRVTNLVMAGAYLKHSGALTLAAAQQACTTVLADKPALIAVNQKALALGYNL